MHQQDSDETALDQERTNCPHDIPVVLFPQGQRPEPNDAAGGHRCASSRQRSIWRASTTVTVVAASLVASLAARTRSASSAAVRP